MKFIILILLGIIGTLASHDHKHFDIKACLLPYETGDCRAMFHKFYFNSTTHDCEEFVYGGCGGNQNNFEHKEDCLKHCKHANDIKKHHHGHSGSDSILTKNSCIAFIFVNFIFTKYFL